MNNYKTHYRKTILPQVQKELGINNLYAAPRLMCVHVNVGIGTYLKTHKDFTPITENVTRIAGQKPVVTKARMAISNFKLREGQPNGITVTLRGNRMYDFVNKLTNVVLPRVRDFRGISAKSFDSQGNYSLGIIEHTVFPEARTDDELKPFSLQVTIVTTARTAKEGETLLRALGFPFRKEAEKKK